MDRKLSGDGGVGAVFNLVEDHVHHPGDAPADGRLVLSRLRAGASALKAQAPSIKLVLEGEELYRVDGRGVRLRPGQLLFLDAGEACEAEVRRGVSTLGLCLYLPRPATAGIAADLLLGRTLLLPGRTGALGRLLEDAARRIANDPAVGPAAAGPLVRAAGAALGGAAAEQRDRLARLDAVKPATRHQLLQRLEVARALLHETSSRAVPLDELARAAGLSRFHLARYFAAAFGRPPAAYHRALRLGRAADALRAGRRSATEIAEDCGYAELSAFSHAFRREFGRSPAAWAREAG